MTTTRWTLGFVLCLSAIVVSASRPEPVFQAATTAIVGATVIDGTGGPPLSDAVIVVSGSRITAIGPRTAVTIPAGATQIDARGRWIIPA